MALMAPDPVANAASAYLQLLFYESVGTAIEVPEVGRLSLHPDKPYDSPLQIEWIGGGMATPVQLRVNELVLNIFCTGFPQLSHCFLRSYSITDKPGCKDLKVYITAIAKWIFCAPIFKEAGGRVVGRSSGVVFESEVCLPTEGRLSPDLVSRDMGSVDVDGCNYYVGDRIWRISLGADATPDAVRAQVLIRVIRALFYNAQIMHYLAAKLANS